MILLGGCSLTDEQERLFNERLYGESTIICKFDTSRYSNVITVGMTSDCIDSLIGHNNFKSNTSRFAEFTVVQRVYMGGYYSAERPNYVYLTNGIVTSTQY